MKTLDIKNRFTGALIISAEFETCADLRGANLRGADLSGSNLCGANLSGADLRGADLRETDLRETDLRGANLSGADLSGSNLYGANLSRADLSGADLSGADLSGAYISRADLSGANLSRADLCGADLSGSDLCGADLSGANLFRADLCNVKFNQLTSFLLPICPDGEFIAYKKANKHIIVLKILKTSKRSNATSLKCRCDKAKVLKIEKIDGTISELTQITSDYDSAFLYKLGKIVKVKNFDENRFNECSTGMHFFINRQSAVNYE